MTPAERAFFLAGMIVVGSLDLVGRLLLRLAGDLPSILAVLPR